ncbi:hypothetical protein P7M46_07430 [Bisgaard Taxon 10/6]|uniref:hypothetical protein n=1 Tax=Exercitatus varius TaxID=67857 RepID=UPI00294A9AB4|nr:hypothetical protein [Exercitatus varius]MDG2917835.1 hypothetical protein [Exercitatus varius]
MDDVFISNDELEKLKNEFISLKGSSGLDILKFVANNLKHTKESALLSYEQKGIEKEKVLTFIRAQERTFNDLLSLSKKHRTVIYEFLDFKPDDEKIISYENNLALLFEIYTSVLKTYINDLFNIIEIKPTLDRIEKGKRPKAKKPEQIKAEEWAKDIWEKDPSITQENMAYQLKDKLDLNQSIRTIINWIKPLQPKP